MIEIIALASLAIGSWLGHRAASSENEEVRQRRLARLQELERQRQAEIAEGQRRARAIQAQGVMAETVASIAQQLIPERSRHIVGEASVKREGIGSMARTAVPFYTGGTDERKRDVADHVGKRSRDLARH